MPPSGLNVDQIWQSLNTNTGKRGGIGSLAGLPGVLTHSRALPLNSSTTGPPADAEKPNQVVGPAIDELSTRLNVSTSDRDQLWVIMMEFHSFARQHLANMPFMHDTRGSLQGTLRRDINCLGDTDRGTRKRAVCSESFRLQLSKCMSDAAC